MSRCLWLYRAEALIISHQVHVVSEPVVLANLFPGYLRVISGHSGAWALRLSSALLYDYKQ